jgi:hypothetical protein
VVLGLGVWSFGSVPVGASAADHGEHRSAANAKPTKEEFNDAVRKLWEDHVTWTRLFIVSASADLPDLDATTNRLLQNQQDIGDAIKPYYGEEAGDQLTALLREHILIAADVLNAAKAGDAAGVEASSAEWYGNADDIAAFLSGANPKSWEAEGTKAMMREHLDLTLEEAVAHLEGRYDDDIAAYDKVHDAILHMADAISDGIVKQFPNRFV